MNFFERILFGEGPTEETEESKSTKAFNSGDLTKIVAKKDLDELLKLQLTDL